MLSFFMGFITCFILLALSASGWRRLKEWARRRVAKLGPTNSIMDTSENVVHILKRGK